jgi:hypothetical protein
VNGLQIKAHFDAFVSSKSGAESLSGLYHGIARGGWFQSGDADEVVQVAVQPLGVVHGCVRVGTVLQSRQSENGTVRIWCVKVWRSKAGIG